MLKSEDLNSWILTMHRKISISCRVQHLSWSEPRFMLMHKKRSAHFLRIGHYFSISNQSTQITSQYLTLPPITSPYLASPHLTSHHFTLPRLISTQIFRISFVFLCHLKGRVWPFHGLSSLYRLFSIIENYFRSIQAISGRSYSDSPTKLLLIWANPGYFRPIQLRQSSQTIFEFGLILAISDRLDSGNPTKLFLNLGQSWPF